MDVATGASSAVATFPLDGDVDQLYRVPGADTLVYEATRSSSKVWWGRLVGGRLEAVRRLTLNDADEMQPAWLDDQTIVYQGETEGGYALFAQRLDEAAPRPWAREPGGFLGRPHAGPDGILAAARRPGAADATLVSVVPPDGPHEVWVEDARHTAVRCAPGASPSCLCAWIEGDVRRLAPATDAGCPSTGVEVRVGDLRFGAQPSPDGRAALVVDDEALWRIDVANGAQARVPTGSLGVQFAAWGEDGQSALVTAWTPTAAFVMARVDLAGGQEPVVLQASAGWVASPVLSPDGTALAWQEDQMSARIWRMDGVDLDR
jgi:hypothetical protein